MTHKKIDFCAAAIKNNTVVTKFSLLPFQYLILPESLYDEIGLPPSFLANFDIINDEDLR